MTSLNIEIPEKLIPVFDGESRYRGAYGGRGSGKTRSFAIMAAVKGLILARAGKRGIILCGREYMNSLADSSMAEIKEAIASNEWLKANYDVGEKYIRTNDRRISFEFAGLARNLDSIKSKSQIHILWIDEADPVTETAWVKVIPTVREHNSEIWVTWNPERRGSATDKRFRLSPPDSCKIVEINYNDNPRFPDVLELERKNDLKNRPDQYEHIWEGDYKTVIEGAYFATHLGNAKREKRIVENLPRESLMKVHSFHDIGGASARADAYTIWVCQFVNGKIHVLNYYESVGQTLDYHVNWMRDNGYESATIWLPHDGVQANNITGKRYEDHWRDADFRHVNVVPNQGSGAAMQRVEAVRRIFNKCWFDKDRTDDGRAALGWYHEKIDEERKVGLGPMHDWSSHGADSFGLMAIKYEDLSRKRSGKPVVIPNFGAV